MVMNNRREMYFYVKDADCGIPEEKQGRYFKLDVER